MSREKIILLGSSINSAAALTSNAVVLGAGGKAIKTVAGVTTDGTSKLILGVAGSAVGGVDLKNATSGTITIVPPTGALGTVTLTVPAATDTLVGKTTTDTLTNKRITSRVATVADAASITPNSDLYDGYTVTALAQTLTINAPTGTPTEFQTFLFRFYAAGAQTLNWNAVYAVIGVTLPTVTVAGKYIYVTITGNTQSSKWDVLGVGTQA